MTQSQRIHLPIAAITLLVAALAGAGWYYAPEVGPKWLISVGAMGGIWLVVALMGGVLRQPGPALRFLGLAAVLGGVILAVSLAAALLDRLAPGAVAWSDRAQGVTAGLILALIGNLTPKVVSPLTDRRCSPAATQALQRFSGWTFLLAGLGYAGAWAVLDPALASPVAMGLCAGAVGLVLVRLAWAVLSGRPAGPAAG